MKLAVIQVRGGIHLTHEHRDSLNHLQLRKKNSCVILENTQSYMGVLVKLKDYVTWGEIDEQTLKLLIEKRGKLAGNQSLNENYLKEKTKMGFDQFVKSFIDNKIKLKDVPGLKTYFRLTPPKGGFEREGIKKQFSLGGALGYRKDNINNLLRRMI